MVSDELFELAAEVGALVTNNDSIDEMLARCAEAIVHFMPIKSVMISAVEGNRQAMALKGTAGATEMPGDDELQQSMMIDDQLVGEIKVRPMEPLTDDWTRVLAHVAKSIALGIHRKKIETQLSVREHLFMQFANNFPEVLWITSPHAGRTVWISPGCQNVFGYSVEEAYKNPHVFFQAMLPEDRPRMVEFMENTEVLTVDSPQKTNDIEYRIIRADGEMRWLWTRAFPLFDSFGKVYEICGFTHDITERREADRRVSEFYSTVSHELRTPLTSIRAALGLIEGGVTQPDSAECLELISIARRESDRLIRLISDILDMRKMEAGKLPMKIVSIDPLSLVNATVAAIRGFAQEHDVELVTWIHEERQFFGDYDRVIQVLTNLLSNAIKFSPAGRVVTLNVESGFQGRVRFAVSDQGAGIPVEHQAKLFGVFQQLDSSDTRLRGGTGLGLAISKAIVERMNGLIGFNSDVGKGSTFWFELPVDARDPALSADLEADQPSSHDDVTLREFVDEYTRTLPSRLDSLKGRLKNARISNEPHDVVECLSEVRRIRASAEPCGFHDVARCMLMLEEALMQLQAANAEGEPVWRNIEGALDSTIALHSRA